MRFAVVGCGYIGRIRALCINDLEGAELLLAVDVDEERAKSISREFSCEYSTHWEEAAMRKDIDAVIVATSNDHHAPVSIAAMKEDKHVLCEKPLARSVSKAQEMVEVAQKRGLKLKTGFNHRYHLNVKKAKELLDKGAIGDITFIRARTGHSGTPVIGRWFSKKEVAGGGTFLDNGVHLLDLSRWFMGGFVEAQGYAVTNLWDMDVEDNGFGLFKREDNRVAFIQSSWTEWKGYLYMEVYGEKGYIYINYFPRQVILGKKRDGAGPLEERVYDFSGLTDYSFREELGEFISAIEEDREPLGNGVDGLEAIKMAYAIYESSRTGKAVKLL